MTEFRREAHTGSVRLMIGGERTTLRASRKLSGLRHDSDFLTWLNKERNTDLKPGLKGGNLGATSARRVTTHGEFRFCNLQLDKHRELKSNGIAVVLVRLEQGALHQ